jgi:hypothetical protein
LSRCLATGRRGTARRQRDDPDLDRPRTDRDHSRGRSISIRPPAAGTGRFSIPSHTRLAENSFPISVA